MENKRVLISGAGMAGLTLAYWLKRYGFIPTIVEKYPTLRTGGYKIDIRGVAVEVIKRMGIYQAVFDARTKIRGATIISPDGKSETHTAADLVGVRAEGDLEIVRGDLCEILIKQLSDVEMLFGDSVAELSQDEKGVMVKFEKGGTRTFDLVIGADGLHSNVRRQAFGEEINFLRKLGIYVSFYTIPNVLNLDCWEIEYFSPPKMVIAYAKHGVPTAIAGFAFGSSVKEFDLRNIEQQKNIVREAYADAGWKVPLLLDAMKDTPDFYFDDVAQIVMPTWSKGRVTLVGDAGYCPSPLSGQGTSLALVGAYVLAGELAQAQGDYKTAFANCEKILRPFVKKNHKLVAHSVSMFAKKGFSFTDWVTSQVARFIPMDKIVHFFKAWGVKITTKAANALTLKNY